MNTAHNKSLIIKYKKKKSGWYTHYPINGLWSEEVQHNHFVEVLKNFSQKNKDITKDSQLYIHFPFCPKQCLFCHCFTLITSKKDKYSQPVNEIKNEITLKYELYGDKLPIKDIHFGGGSPSVLDFEQIKDILNVIEKISKKEKWNDVAIEIDPRNNVNEKILIDYSKAGINRISFGIQDFNKKVGKAINRTHTFEEIKILLTDNVREKFRSINFDLLYGLPFQTLDSLKKTLEIISWLKPTRLAYYSFQHRPDLYRHQTAINSVNLPDIELKNAMNLLIQDELKKLNYKKLGLDHYINEDDYYYKDLILKKNIERNAIGYSPKTSHNIIGIGPSAMTSIDGHYFQNFYTLPNYSEKISKNLNPIARGWISNTDDIIRRDVIFDIINNGIVDKKKYEYRYKINFNEYFIKESTELLKLKKENLITENLDYINETEIGKELRIYIANIFDIYKTYKHSKDFFDGKKASDRIYQLRNS